MKKTSKFSLVFVTVLILSSCNKTLPTDVPASKEFSSQPDKISQIISTSVSVADKSKNVNDLVDFARNFQNALLNSEAKALIPLISHGYIKDEALLEQKAKVHINLYKQFMDEFSGEHDLAIQVDTRDKRIYLEWSCFDHHKSMHNSDPSDKLKYEVVMVNGQMKISAMNVNKYMDKYLPDLVISNNSITFDLNKQREYAQSDFEKLFTGQKFKSVSKDTGINPPDHTFQYNNNGIFISGEKSKLENSFRGILGMLSLKEGDILISGKLKIGDNIDELLEAWPLAEDFLFLTDHGELIFYKRNSYDKFFEVRMIFIDNKLKEFIWDFGSYD